MCERWWSLPCESVYVCAHCVSVLVWVTFRLSLLHLYVLPVYVFSTLHKYCALLSLSSTAESPLAARDKTSLVVHNNHCDHSEASVHVGN